MRRTAAIAIIMGGILLASLLSTPAALGASGTRAHVRVDQLGYVRSERKIAYLLSPRNAVGVPFKVLDAEGGTMYTGRAGQSRGPWNRRFKAVNPLNFSSLDAGGTYRIVVEGAGEAISPWFGVASRAQLFDGRVADTVHFFRAQRDGARVIPTPLDRKPSHVNDASAPLYQWPAYEDPGSDVIVGKKLQRLPGRVDLEGGWFDAGDFIKFTHTTAYAVSLMLVSARTLGPDAPATLLPEARFGLDWLRKTWDPAHGVLYLQVGIGSGNQDGTFNGDHDLWRLPERDDGLAGPANRYLRHRPVFRANEPGAPLPPNLAGRVAAAFALAAQVDASVDPSRARHELAIAAAIYAAAKKRGVSQSDVVTALPHAFYPESSWRDDLELATAELALAAQALGDPRGSFWLHAGGRWARAYLRREAGDDTLNLYDTSALAHADLVTAIRAGGHPRALPITESRLIADLEAQLKQGRRKAGADPFRAGVTYDDFDAAPHAFGLVATAELYRRLTGDTRFAGFASSQRNWALGANAWGTSLMVGVGTTFPHCMQHVVANLSGGLDGAPPLLRGAVVNGPNDKTLFSDGLGEFFSEGRTCPVDGKDRFARFTGRGSRFVDDVRSWQTVEPAIDFTAAAMLAFSLAR